MRPHLHESRDRLSEDRSLRPICKNLLRLDNTQDCTDGPVQIGQLLFEGATGHTRGVAQYTFQIEHSQCRVDLAKVRAERSG